MKALIQILALSLTFAAHGQGTFEAVTNHTSSLNFQSDGTAGWIFSPTVGIRVNALGIFNSTLLGQDSVYVGLWNSAGTLLASNAVTSSDVLINQSRYVSVPIVELVEGQQYHLGAFSPTVGRPLLLDVYGFDIADTISKSPLIQLIGAASLPSAWGLPLAEIDGGGMAYFGPNFTFTLVPEPSALALLAVGALLLAFRRRLA